MRPVTRWPRRVVPPSCSTATVTGKRDDYTEPGQPIDAAKDTRITADSGPYAVMPSPVDGSVWYTVGVFAGRGAVLRLDPGANPPATRFRHPASLRAAVTSTSRALFGCRWEAAISVALTGASARVR